MKILFTGLLVLLTTACGALEPYKLQAYETTKSANDTLLNDALVAACDGPTHGAVKRRFPTAEQRQEFDEACADFLDRKDPGTPE